MENPRVVFILFTDFKEHAYTFLEYLTRENKETEKMANVKVVKKVTSLFAYSLFAYSLFAYLHYAYISPCAFSPYTCDSPYALSSAKKWKLGESLYNIIYIV